jgi:hypothetical protein
MAALSAPRMATKQLGPDAVPLKLKLPIKANTKIYAGSLVCIDAGYAAPARAATTLLVVGRAEATYDNTGGANAAFYVEVAQGAFNWNNSSAGDLIAIADIGKVVYAVDDQTVALTNGSSSRSVAGRVCQIDADGTVWVLSGLALL